MLFEEKNRELSGQPPHPPHNTPVQAQGFPGTSSSLLTPAFCQLNFSLEEDDHPDAQVCISPAHSCITEMEYQ